MYRRYVCTSNSICNSNIVPYIGNRLAQYDGNIDFRNKDWATVNYDKSVGTVLSLATGMTNRMVGLILHKYASTAQVLITKVIFH
jgi:hypothetical protein